MKCHHPEAIIEAFPTHYSEEDVFVLTASVSCKTCGARFRFRGMSMEASPVTPWVSGDGFTVALPMVDIATHVVAS